MLLLLLSMFGVKACSVRVACMFGRLF